MKSIFLSDSDKEAIVEFAKQHEELYDKTNDSFKDKQLRSELWEIWSPIGPKVSTMATL